MNLIKEVGGFTRRTIPDKSEDISEIVNINHIIDYNLLRYVHIYLRSPEECPFARGNWMVEMYSSDENITIIRLPKEMQKEEVIRYCDPLLRRLIVSIHMPSIWHL